MWIKEEALVDSGAIDCVADSETLPHLEVESTPESRRGASWACAGGKEIAKKGPDKPVMKDRKRQPEEKRGQGGQSRPNIGMCEQTPRCGARVVCDEVDPKDR